MDAAVVALGGEPDGRAELAKRRPWQPAFGGLFPVVAGGGHRRSHRRRLQALAAQEVAPWSVWAYGAPHVPELASTSFLKFCGGLALTPDGRFNYLLDGCGIPQGRYGQRYDRGCQPDYEEHGLRCWSCGCPGFCAGGQIPATPDIAPMTPKQWPGRSNLLSDGQRGGVGQENGKRNKPLSHYLSPAA